jgi:hypothetical protein
MPTAGRTGPVPLKTTYVQPNLMVRTFPPIALNDGRVTGVSRGRHMAGVHKDTTNPQNDQNGSTLDIIDVQLEASFLHNSSLGFPFPSLPCLPN